MTGHSPTPSGPRLADVFGPERVALALSVLVVVVLLILLGFGPFAAGPQPPPLGSPAPSPTGATTILPARDIVTVERPA